MFGKPCFRTFPKFSKLFDPKTRFCNPKTENFIRTFFAKFLRVKKTQLFPKNFRTSKNKLFRNSRKQKVRKFLSNAGPYFKYIISLIFWSQLNYMYENKMFSQVRVTKKHKNFRRLRKNHLRDISRFNHFRPGNNPIKILS